MLARVSSTHRRAPLVEHAPQNAMDDPDEIERFYDRCSDLMRSSWTAWPLRRIDRARFRRSRTRSAGRGAGSRRFSEAFRVCATASSAGAGLTTFRTRARRHPVAGSSGWTALRRTRCGPSNGRQYVDEESAFADAWQADDINGVVALLSDDAWRRMSPSRREYRGQNAVGTCLRELAGGAAVVDSNVCPCARTPNPRSRPRSRRGRERQALRFLLARKRK